jgi:hypothetical protein
VPQKGPEFLRGESVMEGRQEGIFRLCIIGIFFCVSIFFLNNNKKKFITATHIDVCNVKSDMTIDFSLDQVYRQMGALFLSHDTDLIVKAISQFKYNVARDLIQKMIHDDAIELLPEEKIEIIYGLVSYYSCPKRNVQYELLDFLCDYHHLDADNTALLTLARSRHVDMIGLFIAWGKDRQKTEGRSGMLARYAERAFTVAIEDDDYAAVETLFTKKVRIAQPKASRLLWDIVEQNKDSRIISLLIDHAQADVNCAVNGKTLLIAAVEKNNVDAVRILLDKGAVVDRIVDSEKGTALAVAMKHNYHSVEQLLREYGD